jgi:hypothetical protein
VSAPNTNPWPGDAAGTPQYQNVSVTGFTPGGNVYIQVCDGVDPASPGWDAAEHCDLNSTPAAATPDGSGNATFVATDFAHKFRPFKGVGPGGSFICLSPTGAVPPNPDGLAVFRNCKIRATSNPTANTTDQSFLSYTLPEGGTPPPDTPEVPFAVLLPLGAVAVGGAYFLIRKRRHAGASA